MVTVLYHGMFILSSNFDINASGGAKYWLGSYYCTFVLLGHISHSTEVF